MPYTHTHTHTHTLNKSWQQHPTRHQLYGHLPPITKTIQARRTRHAGHCWRSKDEIVSDLLQWTPAYGQSIAGRPARTYIQQLCEDTGCSPEDLPEAMNDWETWKERVRDICASGTTWWWYIYVYIYLYIYVYLGSISSLMQISLNIIDILCLHIFFWIRSNSRITFIVFVEELIFKPVLMYLNVFSYWH